MGKKRGDMLTPIGLVQKGWYIKKDPVPWTLVPETKNWKASNRQKTTRVLPRGRGQFPNSDPEAQKG